MDIGVYGVAGALVQYLVEMKGRKLEAGFVMIQPQSMVENHVVDQQNQKAVVLFQVVLWVSLYEDLRTVIMICLVSISF